MSVNNLICTLVDPLNAPNWFPNKCYCFHSKIISNGVHCGVFATFESTTWLLSVIKSSLSKRIIKLYHLYPDNSIKTRKQIDCNAYLLGEATVSEWIWVSFYWIQFVVTVTDACAVWVNTLCWGDTVCTVTSSQWCSLSILHLNPITCYS